MSRTFSLLIVEDDELSRWSAKEVLSENEQLNIGEAESAEAMFRQLKKKEFDIILLDIGLPGMSGIDALKKLAEQYPEKIVIMLTAQSDEDIALKCIEIGAYDYLKKPMDVEAIDAVVRHVIQGFEDDISLEEGVETEGPEYLQGLIGVSDEMLTIRKQIQQIVSSQISTVLIHGESGTGKEVIAQSIHTGSCPKGNFMSINCAALPEHLLESEFFGHEKGAFTDAKEKKLGLFELADNGTILLDEIGELPLPLQSKLLRVIEMRAFKRVGGVKDIPLKARIIAATNRDLEKEVEEGTFRQDLYYRLNVIPLHIPPLRVRRRDIQALAKYFVTKLNEELNTSVKSISTGAMSLLCKHSWPGNARELRNVLERIMVMNTSSTIMVDHLPPNVTRSESETVGAGDGNVVSGGGTIVLPDEGIDLETVERELIRQALEKADNNITKAGALLGLHRDTLRYRAKKFDLIKE